MHVWWEKDKEMVSQDRELDFLVFSNISNAHSAS